MDLRSPGPSSTESAWPVFSTVSPGRTPVVSSYTWTVAVAPTSRMTSPTRPRSPTRTTSNIFAPSSPSAITTGPLTLPMTPMELLLPWHGQGHAEHPLREEAQAFDLVLPARRRYEDHERTEGRLRVRAPALGESLRDGLARDDEAELVRLDDPTELGRRVR